MSTTLLTYNNFVVQLLMTKNAFFRRVMANYRATKRNMEPEEPACAWLPPPVSEPFPSS